MRQKGNAVFALCHTSGNGCVDRFLSACCHSTYRQPSDHSKKHRPRRRHTTWTERPRLGQTTMKRTFLIVAVALLMISASGCASRRGLFGPKRTIVARPVGRPVYTQCVPSSSGCSSCGGAGAVSYGYEGATIAVPSPAGDPAPMAFPQGSGTNGQ